MGISFGLLTTPYEVFVAILYRIIPAKLVTNSQ